jgi:hypothetical protein
MCNEKFTADEDLEDLLAENLIHRVDFPLEFYDLCPRHKKEKYDYDSVEAAVAFQLVEGQRTSNRRRRSEVLTESKLKRIGVTQEQIKTIRQKMLKYQARALSIHSDE